MNEKENKYPAAEILTGLRDDIKSNPSDYYDSMFICEHGVCNVVKALDIALRVWRKKANQVRRGYWVFGYCEKEQMQCTICSSCGEAAYWDTDYGQQQFRYCPYCGAYMENGGVR